MFCLKTVKWIQHLNVTQMFLSEEWVSLIFLFFHLKHTLLVFFRAATVWGNTIQYLEDPVSIADGTLLIMSVHLLVLHSSPAWIESTLQFHLSPGVGTVHQGKFWLAEKQMERRVHCQCSCRVYKRMWRWCLYLFEVRHLKETGARAEPETKKNTQGCADMWLRPIFTMICKVLPFSFLKKKSHHVTSIFSAVFWVFILPLTSLSASVRSVYDLQGKTIWLPGHKPISPASQMTNDLVAQGIIRSQPVKENQQTAEGHPSMRFGICAVSSKYWFNNTALLSLSMQIDCLPRNLS